MDKIIEKLLSSTEPSIVYKTRVNVLGENPDSTEIEKLQHKIVESKRVRKLLSRTDESGRLKPVNNPYKKWYGAHWVLARLADIGYPKAQKELLPLRDQIYEAFLAQKYLKEFKCESKSAAYSKKGVPVINGRARRCASQQGNALYSTLALGIADQRAERLAQLLIKWQWPDGGWPAEGRFYKNGKLKYSGTELVTWGGVNKKKTNEWVTVDALYVLKEAGRI